ncbi:MAG: AEC family transporter [Ruminococcus sp.]|nr:AEC family transporter [Ruminococcus sp.]
MSVTILRQTVIMLMLIAVGVLCNKTKLISESSNRDLSKLVLQVVNPAVIFMSYQTDYRPELARDLLFTFALSGASFAVTLALAYIFVRRREDRETEIERFSAVYSNCGFMGIPLADALFGMEGVFYLTAFITVFNLLAWTHGIILISGERSVKQVVKVFYSPTIISIALGLICFFLQIRLPDVPARAVGYIKELNTPLAMIVSGVSIANTDIPKLLRNARVYLICALRLLILPAAVVLSIAFLPVNEKVIVTVAVASAAPPAAMCTLQSIRYGRNALYASEIFAAGTVLSVATLPLIVRLTECLTNLSR